MIAVGRQAGPGCSSRTTSGLTSADLAALVYGGEAQRVPFEKVRSAQLNKHKLMLWAVVRIGTLAVPEAGAGLRRHYDLLVAVEKTAPEAVRTVIRQPHVGAWAVRCLRRISAEPGSASADLDYLGAIAASAAIRAGFECSLTLRVKDGALMLPTLGRALLPGTHATVVVSGPGKASIVSGDSAVQVSPDPHADVPGWQGLRLLAMGDRLLFLDDLDPNRSYEPYPLPERLDARDVARWQDALDEAWRLLARDHPSYAAGIQDGLMSLVPIGQRADDRNVSATSGDAFGAVAASRPSDGAALAVTLVHELQHAKLCAISDVEPLSQHGPGPVFYAGWRPDPRPAGALLHGIFAHMAVADFWRVHRRAVPGREQLIASVEFARWRRQTYHAARLLDGHDVLTAAGRQLMSQVMARLTSWLEEPVPGPAHRLAEVVAQDHLISWRFRNLEAHQEDVERLVRDWHAGRPATGVVRTQLRAEPLVSGRSLRPDLLYMRLRDPDQFDARYAGSAEPDVAYARRNDAAAAHGYLTQLRHDPALAPAWTGLGVTTGTATFLGQYPDVTYAVHRQIAVTAQPPDPLRLGNWLRDVSPRDLGVHV